MSRLTIGALAVACGLLAAGWAIGEERVERVFEVVNRGLDEAYLAIAGSLGPNGEVAISKATRRLAVTDEPRYVEAVAEALKAFDVPPRRVMLSLRLVRAERLAEPRGEPLEGVPPNLRELVNVNTFEELGEAHVGVVEEQAAEVDVGELFRIAVRLGEVEPGAETMSVRLRLSRRKAREGVGSELKVLAEYEELVRAGRLHVVGYTTPRASDSKLLFLFVVAEIQES